MADDKLNVNPAIPQDGDDTVTRKTIKLRPASIVTAPTAAAQPAAPRPASNTDTGNIDLAEDTQTRRTIKLKPVTPVITAKPAAPAAAPTAAPAAQTPTPAPAVAAAKPDGEDTVTRKTIKLRPLAAGGTAVKPAATAAAAPASAAPASADESGEKTIRIQRPALKPVTGPATAQSRPVSAAPLAGVKPAAPTAGAKPAAPAQAVKIPTVQKPAAAPAGKKNATLPQIPFQTEKSDAIPTVSLVLTLLTLICVIYSTLLITVQFLDLTQTGKYQKFTDAVRKNGAFMLPKSKTK